MNGDREPEPDGGPPERRLAFAAEEGAWPLGGCSGRWQSPESRIEVWADRNVVTVDAAAGGGRDRMRLEFAGPGGALPAPGLYTGGRPPAAGSGPAAVRVVANGEVCADGYAAVRIWRLERDAADAVTAFDASLVHRCGSESAPALRAHVRYRA